MRSTAFASTRDLSSVISVGKTYYLPKGSGWVDSGKSSPASLPWGKGASEQVVAVRWALQTAATHQITTGDTFTFSVPLTFTKEATSTVLSPVGTWVGVATFSKSGTIKVVFNTSALASNEMPLRVGYIPFIMTRPSTGSGSGSGSTSSGSGSGSSSSSSSSSKSSSKSSGSSSSSSSSSSAGSTPGSAASAPSQEATPVAASVTPTATAPVSEPATNTPVAAPPATPQKPAAPDPKASGFNFDLSQIGTVALAVLSAGIVFLALLIAWKRRRLSV